MVEKYPMVATSQTYSDVSMKRTRKGQIMTRGLKELGTSDNIDVNEVD